MERRGKMAKRFFKGRPMNIVILNLSGSSIFFLKILSKFGLKFHYLNANNDNKKRVKNIKNIFPIKFNNNKKPLRLLKYYDYGDDEFLFINHLNLFQTKLLKI